MAYINITGDSDGDLHDAAMHNNKFGAIASVLNGNISAENLANPYSVYTMTFGAGPGTLINPATVQSESWITLTSATSAGISINSHVAVVNANQCLMPSWTRIVRASTLLSAQLVFIGGNGPGSSSTPNGKLQKSATLTGTYSDIASTGTLELYDASAPLVIKESALSISSNGVNAGEYIRFVWNCGSTNVQFPPKMTLTLTFKSEHVS